MPTVGRGASRRSACLPSRSVHTVLGAVGGRKLVRLLGKLSVSGLQRVGRGRIGHGRAEDAAASTVVAT